MYNFNANFENGSRKIFHNYDTIAPDMEVEGAQLLGYDIKELKGVYFIIGP